MPCLDIDLYRNTHAHTHESGIHTLLHACIDTLAQVLRVYTRATHSVTYMHVYTRTPTHTHTRPHIHMLSQHREAGLYIYEREMLPIIPNNKYIFIWSKHRKIKVTNSRGNPVIVCQLQQNVSLTSSRPVHEVSKFGTMSSLSLSLLYTEMYNIHGGSCWTDQLIFDIMWWWETTEIFAHQKEKTTLSKDRECALNIHIYSVGSEKALLLTETWERCSSANLMLWQPWTTLDVWAGPQQNSVDEERITQILQDLLSSLEKGKKTMSTNICLDDVCFFCFLCLHQYLILFLGFSQ